jgi:hypothetical protein
MAGAKTRKPRDIIPNVERTRRPNELERISAMIEEAESSGPRYWHSRAPEERIKALELMRQRAYGYDALTAPRLKRVLEIVQLKLGQYHIPVFNYSAEELEQEISW